MEELTVENLLNAYLNGYFPMADSDDGEIYWYSPDPRAIIPFENYKPHKSLRPVLNQQVFEVRYNTDFEKVMRLCGKVSRPHEAGTWISEDLISAYLQLHQAGFAHSVETYQAGKLVGGLYGVAIGGAFFGESMFHLLPNASKVAFHYLIQRLENQGFSLLDTQFINDNVKRFGAIEIPKNVYLQKLVQAVKLEVSFI